MAGSSVVGQSTHYQKFSGSNPATAGTGREKIARRKVQNYFILNPKPNFQGMNIHVTKPNKLSNDYKIITLKKKPYFDTNTVLLRSFDQKDFRFFPMLHLSLIKTKNDPLQHVQCFESSHFWHWERK